MLLEMRDNRRNNPKTNVLGLETIDNHALEFSLKAQSMIVIPVAGIRTTRPMSYRHPTTVIFLPVVVLIITVLIAVLIAVHRAAPLFK
jgi:hypothetical protein